MTGDILDEKTKGNPYMRHLDIYARRDPQLAPYLLREVNIEFKRRCTKVSFVFWVAVLSALTVWDQRVNSESFYYLRMYAEQTKILEDMKDIDASERRRALVDFLLLVREAFSRNAEWTILDSKKAKQLFV